MSGIRRRRTLRLAAAIAVGVLSLVAFASTGSTSASASGHHATADVRPSDSSTSCPPEAATCTELDLPCPGCTATAGPVTNLGQNQAVWVDVAGAPVGDEIEIALCSLASSTAVVAEPQCASDTPGSNGAVATPSLYEMQYAKVTSQQTFLTMPTELVPDITGNKPIVSQTPDQAWNGDNQTGGFFCDNSSTSPCAIQITDIPESQTFELGGTGQPPRPAFSPVGHSVLFPIGFNEGGSGCGAAPQLAVDIAYSAAQFVPDAAAATCTDPNGVAAIATPYQSVDAPQCATGGGSACPIEDVIDGNVPVTFTDDPEDPATLSELKAAGGKFAYIPIAVSATEIAFVGAGGVSSTGNPLQFPFSSYELTPAQAAGIMTQLWSSPVAGTGAPDDDLCGQLTGKAQCKEKMQSASQKVLVETADGKSDNLDITNATTHALGLKPKTLPFSFYTYAFPDDYAKGVGEVLGGEKTYYGDTGYVLLNPWPFTSGGSQVSESNLAAMWPSVASGASYETSGWMCGAPTLHYNVNLPFGGQASVQDIMSGQQIVADAEQGPVPAQGNSNGFSPGVVAQRVLYPPNTCQALSALPIDFANSQAGNNAVYNPSSEPLLAAHAMDGAIPKYSGSGGFAFTAMDSSEADFYGLLPASLQNAAGTFAAPDASSIIAALKDTTTNPDGTITPNFNDTGDAAAYPLPMVTYALVSTAPQATATQATQLKDLLTNLVNFSTAGGSSSQVLPAGYVPLPSNLSSAALADISNDIVGPGGSSTGNSGSGGSGSGGSSGTNSSGGRSGAAPAAVAAPGATGNQGGILGRGATASSASPTGQSSTGSSGSSGGGNVVGHLITVTVGDSRYFVPSLLVFALLCLLGGPLLYLSPELRRARARPVAPANEELTGERGPPEDA